MYRFIRMRSIVDNIFLAGASETAVDRRERLRKLALETIDLAKDPYILRSVLVAM